MDGKIELVIDTIPGKLDDLADLCEYWKRRREAGMTPKAIRAALLMLANELTVEALALTHELRGVLEEVSICSLTHPRIKTHIEKKIADLDDSTEILLCRDARTMRADADYVREMRDGIGVVSQAASYCKSVLDQVERNIRNRADALEKAHRETEPREQKS